MDSDELIRMHIGVIARDHESLTAFEAHLRSRAIGRARRIGLPNEDAEEVWQDVFLDVVERAPDLEPLGRSLVTYALTAVHHASVDRIRASVRRGEVSLDASDPDTDWRLLGSGASSISDASAEALRRCLEALGLAGSRVVEMISRGLTAAEIGKIIDKSPAAVAKIWQRGRSFLRQCLGGVAL